MCRSEPHMQRGHNVCRGGVNYRRVPAIHKDEPKYDEIIKIDLDSLLRSQAVVVDRRKIVVGAK